MNERERIGSYSILNFNNFLSDFVMRDWDRESYGWAAHIWGKLIVFVVNCDLDLTIRNFLEVFHSPFEKVPEL